MKKGLVILFFSLILGGCASSKERSNKQVSKTDKIVANALKYKGVKYKFGGTTKRGMDCSGVIFVAFGKENVLLPRVSRDMAKRGKKVSLRKAKKGDLLFFKTQKSKRKINHVGLIMAVKNGQIWFIHATSSKGVIVSSLSQKYWKKAFVKATSIL
ncbi:MULTISPECIES: C40 family peptidase [unclassified Polaribacter]|uniref:C40 family peptidase n=1 Tax=unclassified Polaribacter TaxID=196858 RepID=UPI0011BD52BD|nr:MULTISPECIES: C40 family peptidase [unclassified Polaribacter]TXD51653.1 NlpC/P60 family protein [Polaribacter sp. IC063]TXD58813.1 NlpC/P60 family protein [Polaribacter sp. IC066]